MRIVAIHGKLGHGNTILQTRRMDTEAPTVTLSCNITPIPLLTTSQEVDQSEPYYQFIGTPCLPYDSVASLSKIGATFMVTFVVTENVCDIWLDESAKAMVMESIDLAIETLVRIGCLSEYG